MEDMYSDTSVNQSANTRQIPAYYHLSSNSTPETPYMPSSAYSYQYPYQYSGDFSTNYGVNEAIPTMYHAGNTPYSHQYNRNDHDIKHSNHVYSANFSNFTSSPTYAVSHKEVSNKIVEPLDSVYPNMGYPLNGTVNSLNVEQAYNTSPTTHAQAEFPSLPTEFQNPSLSEKIICAFLVMPRNQEGFTASEVLTVINTLLFSNEASLDQIEQEMHREDWFQSFNSANKNALIYKINPYCFQWLEKLQQGLHACAIERIMNMNHQDLRLLQALPFASEWIGGPLNNRDQQLTRLNTNLCEPKSNDEHKRIVVKNSGYQRDVLVERATTELLQLLTALYDKTTIENIIHNLSALQPKAKPAAEKTTAEKPTIKPSKLHDEFEGLEYAFRIMVLEVLVLYHYETLYEPHIGIRSRDIGYRITKKYTWLGKLPFRKLSEMVNEALELGPYIGHKRNSSRNAYWELDLNKLIHMGRVIN